MNSADSELRIKSARVAQWVIIAGGFILLLVAGKSFLIPLVLAIFFTLLINAIRNAILHTALGKRYLGRKSGTALAIIFLLLLNAVVVSLLTVQVEGFRQLIPTYEQNISHMMERLLQATSLDQLPTLDELASKIEYGSLLSWLGDSLSITFSNVFLTVLYTAFLIAEEASIPQKLARLQSDPARSEQVKLVCSNIAHSVQKYISMKTVVSAATGICSYIVLAFFKVDFAGLWAFVIFLLNFIPNIGSILGVMFPSLLTLLQFESLTPFFMVTASLGLIQFIIGNIIEPSYFGKNLNLSSFVVLLSLSFWGTIWGLVGMFLSVPMVVVASLVCQHIKGLQWISVLMSGDGSFMDAKPEQKPRPGNRGISGGGAEIRAELESLQRQIKALEDRDAGKG